MIPRKDRYYTCPNSSLIVHVYKIRYKNEDYSKVWLKYYSRSGTYLTEERNVKLIHKNIQHWEHLNRLDVL